jgi:hypothetical protein
LVKVRVRIVSYAVSYEKAVSDLSEVDEPDRLAGARPRPQRPPRRFQPLEGGSDPPCCRLPFTSRPHAHPCRSLLVAPRSAKQGVVTLFARWVSVGTSAHIYAATRHVVSEAQSLTSPRGLTRHPTGRDYAGWCIPSSENSPSPKVGEY